MNDNIEPAAEVEPAEVVDSGAPGGFDFGQLMGMAQNMQSQMADTQDRLANTVVEGTSGGGAVVIGVTGGFQFQSVRIDADVIDPADPSMLEDLVLAALLDATAQVEGLQAQANPLAGLDLGGLGGLLGGA